LLTGLAAALLAQGDMRAVDDVFERTTACSPRCAPSRDSTLLPRAWPKTPAEISSSSRHLHDFSAAVI
jgi:hypothetical protein